MTFCQSIWQKFGLDREGCFMVMAWHLRVSVIKREFLYFSIFYVCMHALVCMRAFMHVFECVFEFVWCVCVCVGVCVCWCVCVCVGVCV